MLIEKKNEFLLKDENRFLEQPKMKSNADSDLKISENTEEEITPLSENSGQGKFKEKLFNKI